MKRIVKSTIRSIMNKVRPASLRSCSRCQGLLVTVRFLDIQQSGQMWGSGWRCVNCGAIVDSVIEANRRRVEFSPVPPRFNRRRTKEAIPV